MYEEMAASDPNLVESLREADARADRAERALVRLQGSFTMTVGQLVIDAGQSPRRLIMLPLVLLRMRRNRRALRATKTSEPTQGSPASPRDISLRDRPKRLFLPRRVVTLDQRSSYVVIGPPEFVNMLRQRAHVSEALPHNALELVYALDPDAVIVHAHAGYEEGVWTPLGIPGEAVRESILVNVLHICRELGRPIAFVNDPTAAPGLTPFAETCDLVVDVGAEEQLPDLLERWAGQRDA
jgi:hypothetical protein